MEIFKPMLRSGATRRMLAIVATALALATPQLALAQDRFVPGTPEPGADIPSSSIKFGMRAYPDNTFYYIGMKKGWFDDVGIKFDPSPYGIKANDSNVLTLMLNGDVDMISEYCPLILPTYTQSKVLKCVASTDSATAFCRAGQSGTQAKDAQAIHCRGQEL